MSRRKISRIRGLRDFDFSPPPFELSGQTKRRIAIILLITVGLITLLSLFDLAGAFGIYLNNILKILFGSLRWYLPIILLLVGYFLLRPIKYAVKAANIVGLFIFIFSFNGLVHLLFHQDELVPAAQAGLGGGYSGLVLSYLFMRFMGFWAGVVIGLALTVIGFFLLFDVSLPQGKDDDDDEDEGKGKGKIKSWLEKLNETLAKRKMEKAVARREKNQMQNTEPMPAEPIFSRHSVEIEQQGDKRVKAKEVSEEEKENKQLDLGIAKFKKTKIDLPLDLLDGKTTIPDGGDLKTNKMIIQKTLSNFGIEAEMGEAQVGPTVTQYTLKPAEGVKLSRITSLSDNFALALAAHPIRIEAPIPGRSLVGIEVPNQATALVPLKEILASEAFHKRRSNLIVALGKDVMGRPWLSELDRMPHLLIAGATGSGKSVCINAIILSLLFQNGPGDLKLILVDPKRVELPIYNGIPHLLTPVITDVKKTINALRWAIKEMENRFDILSKAHHRNIGSFNAVSAEKMPYIVVVIDELADLMAAAGVEVEAAIVRLAQMSRAVGIHLVLATQRPSVDVLTGLIKANITSRVAFSVASLVDSRTILDMSGAEKLLGRGDMLYISAEISKPKRLQGAYSSDEEIKRVISYLKERAEPDYIDEVVEKQQVSFEESDFGETDESDPLLPEAKEVILLAKKASASLLQRRLRVGYARAARILDLLEHQGFIGPGEGAKPREVLGGGMMSTNNESEIEENEDMIETDNDDILETDEK